VHYGVAVLKSCNLSCVNPFKVACDKCVVLSLIAFFSSRHYNRYFLTAWSTLFYTVRNHRHVFYMLAVLTVVIDLQYLILISK
jgi:hypothetical protein